MTRQTQITIANELSELPRASECFETFAEQNDLPARARTHILIVLDEILTNVVKYAWDDGARHDCRVSFSLADDRVEIDVVDDGRPFDPLADGASRDGERTRSGIPVGGRGLVFVGKLMNDVRYVRADGRNRLTLVKLLKPGAQP